MSFTAKVRISIIEKYGNGQQRVSFTANYTDPKTGERVNQDWAQATPAFSNDIFIIDDVVESQGLKVGQCFTLTYDKDSD
jgi:hypothetical protein